MLSTFKRQTEIEIWVPKCEGNLGQEWILVNSRKVDRAQNQQLHRFQRERESGRFVISLSLEIEGNNWFFGRDAK